jgi:uncharacterized protein YhdP
MTVAGRLVVPLNRERAGRDFDADLAFTLKGVDLDAPDYRLPLVGLEGGVRYRYPKQLEADRIAGSLVGEPVVATVETAGDRILVHASGEATAESVWHLTGLPGYSFVGGRTAWEGELAIAPDGRSELRLKSELEGVEIGLPSRLGKSAAEPRAGSINLQFLEGYQALRFGYGDVEGWLHLADGPRRGAVGLGVPHPMVATDGDALVIAGRLGRVDLEELLAAGEQVGEGPARWQLRGVEVEQLEVGDTQVNAVTVNGSGGAGDLHLEFESAMLAGSLTRTGAAPLDLHFNHLRLPGGDEDAAGAGDGGTDPVLVASRSDPLSPDVLARLPAASVVIDEASIGDISYGNWSFDIVPEPGGVRFANASGAIRGVEVAFPGDLHWDAQANRSAGAVTMTMTDLSKVLPQWGFAPSLETESATISAELAWPGSPLNVALVDLDGTLDFDAQNGRFLDAEGTNALRIFSLLNFAAITKRLTFDFSDVVGKGVSFDTIQAPVEFGGGKMRFREPMVVDGTGSKFQIGGTVDLIEESVQSDMVLTLPVGKGLPWYAVYIGLANPLLGVGVLVGERMLRKPLEQASSFRYRITGALENPDVEFVSLFGTEVDTAGVDAGG